MNDNKESNLSQIIKWHHLASAEAKQFSDHDEYWNECKVGAEKLSRW